jgi:hypothetical protein
MNDTITRLLRVVAERDARQFPTQTDHQTYAKDYVLEMLRDLLRHDQVLDAYFEQRVELIGNDLQAAKDWEPK